MAVNLTTAFSWEAATGDMSVMLDELQPNIIRPHTREFLTVLFLKFGQKAGARRFLKNLVQPATGKPLVKSAKLHLQEIKDFKTSKGVKKGTSYVGVGITALGYDVIGVTRPSDPSFRNRMRNAALNDPAVAQWEPPYRDDISAVVLVGDDREAPRDAALARVMALIASSPGVTVIGQEKGHGQHNANGDGIEHFGYVDGRSQPLFLTEDINDERLHTDGAKNWNPAFAPSRVLVSDAAAPRPDTHCGSYFVFRKLEQDVKKFKTAEDDLAKRLKLTGTDKERAGAMLVGRFEDGTPLTLQSEDGSHHPVPNDFTYNSDEQGGKCPFFAHIRKVNPRGSGGFEPEPGERLHIMARRGQTYGVRTDGLNDDIIANKPSHGVGLLFMAFNVKIAEQFEFAQSTWANNPGFPKVSAPVPAAFRTPGLDLVIGQGNRPDIRCPLEWGADPADATKNKTTTAVAQAVTMKGGEYFFMPSLAFMRAL
jgi:Dyp-type peroxidase family